MTKEQLKAVIKATHNGYLDGKISAQQFQATITVLKMFNDELNKAEEAEAKAKPAKRKKVAEPVDEQEGK